MKTDFQTFTDFTDYTRYTFYETWFNDKIVIVMEEKMMDEDWQVMTSVSLPKPLMEILKLKASGPRILPVLETSQHQPTVIRVQEFLPFLKTSQHQPTVIEQKQ